MGSLHPRGRTSLETQADAVARIAALSVDQEQILAARDRVIGSSAFHSSKRARELLGHILDCALSGRVDQLKERSLGHVVFGREPAYDTGSDSIVRVAANDVRKRLLAYYQQAPDEPVTFELPVGTYIPEIRVTAPVAGTGTAIPNPPVETVPAAPPTPHGRSVPWKAFAIAGWILALLVMAQAFLRKAPAPGPAVAATGLPWSALFRGQQPLQVILADSSMGSLRNLREFPATIEEFANKRFMVPPPDLDPAFRNVWTSLARTRTTSIADVLISARVAALAARTDRPVTIRSARDVQLSELHSGSNVVLLGSSASNPWVILYEPQLAFRIVTDTVHHWQFIAIRDPKPGEPRDLGGSVGSGTTGTAYAVLSLVSSLQGDGAVLIAAGTTMEGTELAGELAFDNAKLGSILRACGAGVASPNLRFEILLKLDVTAGSRKDSEVLATRCIGGV